jgi:hypothetical protein
LFREDQEYADKAIPISGLAVLCLCQSPRIGAQECILLLGTLPAVTLCTGNRKIVFCVPSTARECLDVVDHASKLIQEGRGIPSPTLVKVRSGPSVAIRVDKLFEILQREVKDRGPAA